jgi:flagellar FliL protein
LQFNKIVVCFTAASKIGKIQKVRIMAHLSENNRTDNKMPMGTRILLFAVLPLMTISSLIFGILYFTGTGRHQNYVAAGYPANIENKTTQQLERTHLPAIYIPIEPAFVVNFSGQGKAQFLQISVEIMTRSSDMVEVIRHHMPVIRNNLIMLFSNQVYDKISSLKGKENLRKKCLDTIQQMLVKETGKRAIEAVYFTSLVMQ